MALKAIKIKTILTLLSVVFACLAGWAMIARDKALEDAVDDRQALAQFQSSRLIGAVDTYVSDLRAQLDELGEDMLRQLPLPLTNLTLTELRALDPAIAYRDVGWAQAYVVSLDPATRQFYFENRQLQSNFMFLVSLGNPIGPTAELINDEDFVFALAQPLSAHGWVLIAKVDPAAFRESLAQQLGDRGYLIIEQAGGVVDQVTVVRAGTPSRNAPIIGDPMIGDWVARYQPSDAFLQSTEPDVSSYRMVSWGSLALSVLCAAIAIILAMRETLLHRAAGSSSIEVEPPARPANPNATQTWMSDLGAGSKHIQNGESEESDSAFVPLKVHALPQRIFRANDIRGLDEKEITPQFARQLGRAFATLALESGKKRVFVCRDGREGSAALSMALSRGLVESGCRVIDLGMGPTPLLHRVISEQKEPASGIMVTGSHNPKEYNGFKIVLAGQPFYGDQIQELRQSMVVAEFNPGAGSKKSQDLTSAYIDAIQADLRRMTATRVVVDGANGSAGHLCERALESLGCDVEPLFCEVDGTFPNHGPDPSQRANLKWLCDAVVESGAHYGVALDGDGDRAVAVTEKGEIVTPDQLFMLFAQHCLIARPGAAIVFDVKASRCVPEWIARCGGRPIMERSGRTFIQSRVRQENAALGGEYSSHFFFGDRWDSVDDGIYAACQLGNILRLHNRPFSELLKSMPSLPSTDEIELAVADENKTKFIEEFRKIAAFPGAVLLEIDGLRVEYPQAWGMIRASNTGPKLSLRFEGETTEALEEIQALFRQPLNQLLPDTELPF